MQTQPFGYVVQTEATRAQVPIFDTTLVTPTRARQQTNTPNSHTLSPLTGAWFMVGLFAELSLEVGQYPQLTKNLPFVWYQIWVLGPLLLLSAQHNQKVESALAII